MAKILSRAILIAGEKQKVGTPVVTVVDFDRNGDVTRAYGATLPSDTDAGYATGCIFWKSSGGSVGATVYINEGTAASADFNAVTSGAAGGISTWDQLYDNDKSLAIDDTTLTFDVAHATANGLSFTTSLAGSGNVIDITNTGTGKDIDGTSSTWSVSKAGAILGISIADSATNGTLAVDGNGSGGVDIGSVSTGGITLGAATSVAASKLFTVAGVGGSDMFDVTAGDVTIQDGSVTITDADAAATLVVTNNTAATVAGVVKFVGNGVTTGTLLRLESSDAGLTSGSYLDAYNGSAVVFKVADEGAVTIAGAAASNVLTVTAGDAVMSDGSLTITDADDAATLSVTNDSAVSASMVVIAGSGAFTGNTTSSFMTITPSGLTSGTAVYLPVAALTTGKAVHVVANAATDGLVVNVTSSSALLTSTGRLLNISHSGAATVSGVIAEFSSAAADETTIVKITASADLAAGVALDISAAALTTGKVIDMSNLDAITTGKAIHIDATGVTQTDGILVHIDSASTALTSTGRLLLVDHTGAATVSSIVTEIKSAAADETVIMKVTASAALAAGVILDISGASVTTGTALDMGGFDALTTGGLINAVSNSADTGTRTLVQITNDHASATGTTALSIKQDSTGNALAVTAGATNLQGTLTVGVDDTGYDVQLFGATAGAHLLWDESADTLKLVGGAATNMQGTLTVGVDDTGYDVKFFGATASAFMLWDESADDLQLGGAAGFIEDATSLTAAADSGAGSTVPVGKRAINVTGVTTDANDWIVLPAIASVPVGHTIRISANAGSNFEIRTPAASGTKINDVDSDGTQEYLATDTHLIVMTKHTTTGWVGVSYTKLGAVVTAVIPDA